MMKRYLTPLTFAAITLLSVSIYLPNAHAEAFPAEGSTRLATESAHKPSSRPGLRWDQNNSVDPFLNALELSPEQREALSSLIDKQMEAIYVNVTALEHARALLREMALSKHYDDGIAKTAAERIANSSATLAVLQAEREYQLFVLLTPEQNKRYERLKALGEFSLM